MGLLCAMSRKGYSVFIPCSSTYCVPVGVLYTYCVPSTLADSPGDTSPMLTAKQRTRMRGANLILGEVRGGELIMSINKGDDSLELDLR